MAGIASLTVPEAEPTVVSFGTEVDMLMKAIQAEPQTTPKVSISVHDSREDPQDDSKNVKRRYKCQYCNKCFFQKWNRRLHERSHTGFKLYVSSALLLEGL